LENGHGPTREDVATAIERVAEPGAVGCSIEDFDPRGHLYQLAEARERIAAAVEVARRLPFPFTLTARAENHIRGNPDLDDTIARLLAYQEEGADVLFAPGLRESVEIRSICEAVERPLNVLGHSGLSVSEITDAGAQRISVGGALAWTAIEAMVGAAEAMRDSGDLSGLSRPGRIREWIERESDR